MLKEMWRDLLHAGRALAKAPAFTFVCVVSLGVGLAPVIAIQYFMRTFTTPPPGLDTERLVELLTVPNGPHRASDRWSYPDFVDLRNAETGMSITGWAAGDIGVTVPASGETRTSPTMFVSRNYFDTIGVALARGPGFRDTADPLVIVGHAFWQSRLASDPDIVGKTLFLNGVPHVVAGIAPEGFTGHLPLQETKLFLPLERYPRLLADANARFDRSRDWVRIHGRLAAGVSMAQASAAVSAVTAQLARDYPATNALEAGIAAPYHAIGNIEGSDLPIMMAVGNLITAIPLVVVCLNVSGMVQVRSAMRERELSIRQAIGASRRRLIQHLLAEAVLLAGAGGALASLVLFNIPPLLSWWMDEPLPHELQAALNVDFSMLAVTAALCLATSLLFGWLPAMRFSRPGVMPVLKDDAGGGGVRVGRAQKLTGALQVTLAVPLLVLSALSVDRMRATATADFGFDIDLLYAAPLEFPAAAGNGIDFQIRRVRDTLARANGVAAVTIADGLPLDARYRLTRISTQADSSAAAKSVRAHVTRVGEGYLETMGIALLRGRDFTIDDGAGAPLVTVVSEPLADRLFPDSEPLGQRLTFVSSGDKDRTPKTLIIVGVAADFPTSQMRTDREQLLLPLAQHPDVRRDSVLVSDDRQGTPMLMVIARSAHGEPAEKLTAALQNAIREVDPNFDSGSIITGVGIRQSMMAGILDQSIFSGTTGGVALLLAALGIYGVVGLMVTTRTREIAVRVTLGASRRRVIGMILFDVVKLVTPGVALGVLITFAAVRIQGGAVSIAEPLAYVAGAALAVLTAVAASLGPARRAASVQPMVAMRST
jgi:predicted permease